jgi:hypothetical protein
VDTVAHGKTSENDSIFMVASPHRSLRLEDVSWGSSSHSLGIKKTSASQRKQMFVFSFASQNLVKTCSICSQKTMFKLGPAIITNIIRLIHFFWLTKNL